jgi:hypothetical protein
MLCPTHDIHPSVRIIGNEIEIACCCNSFHETCAEKAKEILSNDDFIGGLIFG